MSLRMGKQAFKLRVAKSKAVAVTYLLVLAFFVFGGIAFAATGGGHGESHEAPSKVWEKEDTYRVLNFVVLATALFFVLRKPVKQALNGRIEGIQQQLSDLEAKKEQAIKKLAEYNERIQDLDKEAENIIAEYRRQGEEAKERILNEASAAAEKLELQAKRAIEHEFKVAKAQLQEEILEEAFMKAEELVKSKITSDDQGRLVDEYLNKVVLQ